MSLKKTVTQQAMKLMSEPRVMALMQDERFMKALMAAMSVPGRVSGFAEDQSRRLARMLALATAQEVRDLRRTVRSLEEQIAEIKKQSDKGSNH